MPSTSDRKRERVYRLLVSSPRIIVSEEPAEALVAHVRAAASVAGSRLGAFAIALPGGSVASSCFPLLARAAIDWSSVHLFWGDERAVAPDHADSNFGLARRLLLDHVPIPAENVHRMPADREDLALAAAEHEAELRAMRLDIALLGVGPDGHVCSLFPGHALLDEDTRWVAAIEDSPKPPPRRLTLTLPALLDAREIVIVVTGAAKAGVVREALEDPRSGLPLAIVLRRATAATVILDPAAASELGRAGPAI